jgi:hypothetical protein
MLARRGGTRQSHNPFSDQDNHHPGKRAISLAPRRPAHEPCCPLGRHMDWHALEHLPRLAAWPREGADPRKIAGDIRPAGCCESDSCQDRRAGEAAHGEAVGRHSGSPREHSHIRAVGPQGSPMAARPARCRKPVPDKERPACGRWTPSPAVPGDWAKRTTPRNGAAHRSCTAADCLRVPRPKQVPSLAGEWEPEALNGIRQRI